MTKRKNRAKSGFTLIELLCTIIVLLLVSALMVVGVGLAVKAYDKEVMNAESKELCATLRTVVNDELRYAGTVDNSGDPITFFSQNKGGKEVSFSTDENGQVILGEEKVLSSKAYSYGVRAEVVISSYDESTRVFDASVTVTDENGKQLAKSDFQVKQLNKTKDKTT